MAGLFLFAAEDLFHLRDVGTTDDLSVDEKKGRPRDADPGADLFVGPEEFGGSGIVAGFEFHVVQFSGHRLFIGPDPVGGAEDITDLGLGVGMDIESGKKKTCLVTSFLAERKAEACRQ